MEDPITRIERLRHQRCRRRKDLAIGGVILQMRQHSEQRQKRLGKLIDLWNNLVPPELAAQVIVEGLRRGVLHVSADSSSTSYALDRALREGLLNELRSQFGATLLRVKITLHTGSARERPTGQTSASLMTSGR